MATAEDDRAAYKKEKIRLEVIISELQRKLKAEKFDKEEYLKGLESREQQLESGKKELKSDRADFESQVQNRAKEIEKQVINDAKRKENAAEQARLSLLEQQKAVIGSAVGVSVVFGKLLSEIGINTIMFPIAVYLIYVLIRWLLEIGAVKRVLDGIEKLIKHWNDIESNQKICNLLLTVLMIAAVLMVRSWIKGG